MSTARLDAWIHGRVQGVWYRASTQTEAQRLGLTGWVRNRVDGSVELCAEGERSTLEALLAWCRQGPPQAEVERIEVRWSEGGASPLDGFEVRR